MSHILLVGAGNIGIRHLEGLAQSKEVSLVSVVDPDANALKRAEKRWCELTQVPAVFTQDLSRLVSGVDLAIVATSSRPRPQITIKLLEHGVSRLILEKFLFQYLDAYDKVQEAIVAVKAKAWVNCPRRLYPNHEQVRTLLKGGLDSYEVKGTKWGLACNVIHHIDYWMYINGAKADNLKVLADELEPRILGSKREGYIEFNGRLKARCEGMEFAATCDEGAQITMRTELRIHAGKRIEIDEQAQAMWFEGKECPFPVLYQSQLTGPLVDDIIREDNCGLTRYAESAVYHKKLLKAFLGHLSGIEGKEIFECPIT